MARPKIVETIGDGHTVDYGNGGQNFTTIHRAKSKKYRMRICTLAKASCKKGIKYSKNKHKDYDDFMKKYGSFASRLKAIRAGKAKGRWCDCSGLVQACATGAGASMGYVSSGPLTRNTFSKYNRRSFKNQIDAGTWQRGDIVAKEGHAAIIVDDGPNCKTSFKNYYEDGSKKIKSKKLNKIRNKYVKKYKKKVKKNDTAKEMKAYIDNLKKQKTAVSNEIKAQKKKQTKARKKYIKKLKNTKKTLKKAIGFAEDELKKLKKKKTTKSSAKKTTPKNTTTQNTTTTKEEEEYDDEQIEIDQYAVDGTVTFDEDENDPDMEEGQEPEPAKENVNYYYLRSGPSYFPLISNNSDVAHKDYTGKTFCKRKVKIKTLTTYQNEWTFCFDMPFSTGAKGSNVKSITKQSNNDYLWKVVVATDNNGQVAQGGYTFTLTTQNNINYEFKCEITTYNNLDND